MEFKDNLYAKRQHNCEEFIKESKGCSICSQAFLKSPLKNKEDIKELQEYCNARISQLKAENDNLKSELKEEKSLPKCQCWKGFWNKNN